MKELKKGTIIYHKRGEELELKFVEMYNDQIYTFNGLIFDNDEDMIGHFSKDKEIKLTKNELKDWYW